MSGVGRSRRRFLELAGGLWLAGRAQGRPLKRTALPSGDPTRWSVQATALAIRNRHIGAEQITQLYLDRIERVNGKLNAVVQLAAGSALTQARQADWLIAQGARVGPLHGVPMTIKDSFDTADIVSCAGTMGRRAHVPTTDATVVRRLKSAGAILLGKTNVPELTLGGETDNLVYGRTNNPFNTALTSGGSSGGAAAIVAAGASAFDIGSDMVGSIRLPAHFCGTAGLKPTAVRVPRTGNIMPYGMGVRDFMTQVGPIARRVEDLEILLHVIAGADWSDPAVTDVPFGSASAPHANRMRIACVRSNDIVKPTDETAAAVSRVADILVQAGAQVNDVRLPMNGELEELADTVLFGDGGAWVQRLLSQAGTREPSPPLARLLKIEPMECAKFTAALERVDAYRGALVSMMSGYDALLSPVEAHEALPHGEYRSEQHGFTYMLPFSLSGLPVVVVRAASTRAGLPLGVQIVGRPWREDVCLAVARLVEERVGPFAPPAI